MKKLLPLALAFLGLGAGVGAGLALKPAPEGEVCEAPGPGHEAPPEGAHETAAGAEAEPCADLEAEASAAREPAEKLAYVALDKAFVVPVFEGEKTVAMVVLSLSVETEPDAAHAIEAVSPRLRDSFLKVLFRHANSGGFDGSFTDGRKMDDLKSALLNAAREVLGEVPVEEILITEIARQNV